MLVILRHAVTPHNLMVDGSGPDELTVLLERAVADGAQEADLLLLLRQELTRNRYAENRLPIVSDQGMAQCAAVKEAFCNEGLTFGTCLCSPYRRATQTAAAIVGDMVMCRKRKELCERDLGVFHHLPRELFHRFFPQEAQKKAQDPLGWTPFDGFSMRELWPGLRRIVNEADETIAAGKNALLVAHADTDVSLRALPELGAMSTAQLLTKGPGIWNPLWFQNCQYDQYSYGDPNGGRQWDVPTHFRSVVPYGAELGGTRLDTGWSEIER